MPNILNESNERYLYSLLPERDEVLTEIERVALEEDIPIVGPAVGRLLYQLARMIGAKTVFELGSAVGYSTIWWARAVGKDARVYYTDSSQENAARAKKYLERAGVGEQVEMIIGDAIEALRNQTKQFDIIFNDVDKTGYPEVLEIARQRVRPGGLFITDNTLWSGRVAAMEITKANIIDRAESTQAIAEFNRRLAADPAFFTTILPLRDGVTVALKL